MAITATYEKKERELVPSGNHVARCFKMIELGTIKDEYQGVLKELHKVRFTFELPNEMRKFQEDKPDQPMVIDKEYTLSMYEKATLRKDLESWRGKAFTEAQAEGFDITKLLGVPCMINIIHKTSKKGNDYEVITGITPIPKGMECPDQINPSKEISFDSWKQEDFDSLPDFLKEKITSSKEYQAIFSETPTDVVAGDEDQNNPEEEDDLPF